MTSQKGTWTIIGDENFRCKAAKALSKAEKLRPEIAQVDKVVEQVDFVKGLVKTIYVREEGRRGHLEAFKNDFDAEDVGDMYDFPLERKSMFEETQSHYQAIMERVHEITMALYGKNDETIRKNMLDNIEAILAGFFHSLFDLRKAQEKGKLEDEIESLKSGEFRRDITTINGVAKKKIFLSQYMAGFIEQINFDDLIGDGITRLMLRTFQALKDFTEQDTAGFVEKIATGLVTIEHGSFSSDNSTASLYKP